MSIPLLSTTRLFIVKNAIYYRSKFVYTRNIKLRYSTEATSQQEDGWTKWKASLKGFVPIGLCLVAVMQWRYYRKRMSDRTANDFEVNCYCVLPLRMVSRWWGWLADKHMPEFVRPYIYGLYANTFGVNLSEAANDDLKSYKTLSDFFSRPLKDGVRTIDKNSFLVSPCDGTVLHLGTVHTNHVEQVKGVTYSLENFLGENTWNKNNKKEDYRASLLHKQEENHTLYQCVIYLAPGDYHRFHSPTDWKPSHRRHFHGELLSVNPLIAQWLPGLFCLNERAVYLGESQHGFFSFTAVGATNVGSIKVNFDKSLQTNRPKSTQLTKDKFLGSNLSLKKGDPVGEFRMGSTIVLVFEAPPNFKFNIKCGQKVKMGQGIGIVGQQSFTERVQQREGNISKNVL
nr:phosphatidylserine decarboxylase proenzyme, mitochondrial [Onthophagus taurus]